jgi:hypothetical protein
LRFGSPSFETSPLSKTRAISQFSARTRSRCHVWREKWEIAARLGRMGRREGRAVWMSAELRRQAREGGRRVILLRRPGSGDPPGQKSRPPLSHQPELPLPCIDPCGDGASTGIYKWGGASIQKIQVYPQDLRALPVHPDPAVSSHSGFRGGAHARPKATAVSHAARMRSRVAARGARAAAGDAGDRAPYRP